MATTAPFVKLLRQLATAKDAYLSGALDITWDGGQATIFFVFGQPTHATFEADGVEPLVGQAAFDALLCSLPRQFTVAPWRKTMVDQETLTMSIDELMEPIAQLTGSHSAQTAAPVTSDRKPQSLKTQPLEADVDSELGFSLEDFPLLPAGEPIWSDSAVNVVHLDLLIPKLPTSLIVLTGPKLRAAAVILNGQIIDAVWVDEQEHAVGEGAAMALIGAREGTVSCYRIDDPRLVEAITMLWRCPARYRDISTAWIDPQEFLDNLLTGRNDCALRLDGPTPAIALFMNGEFIASYNATDRIPSTSPAALLELLGAGTNTITIFQRASDKAVGRAAGEDAYHAYTGPNAASLDLAPSYAAGAAAIAIAADTSGGDAGNGQVEEAGRTDELPLAKDAEKTAPAPALPVETSPTVTPAEVATPAPFFYGFSTKTSVPVPSQENAIGQDVDPSVAHRNAEFDSIKRDLIQIGILWLGNDDVGPIAELIQSTKPSVDDFATTINAIKAINLANHDPSVIRAMAREMHYHAAEYLSGT